MGHYKNFKSVIYCPVHWVVNVKEEELEEQLAFYEKYVGVDKVYVEPYRSGELATKEKLNRMLAENCGKPYEVVAADTDRDNWMTSEEAKEYGLIDKVIVSR